MTCTCEHHGFDSRMEAIVIVVIESSKLTVTEQKTAFVYVLHYTAIIYW